jgi:hypothetical protein
MAGAGDFAGAPLAVDVFGGVAAFGVADFGVEDFGVEDFGVEDFGVAVAFGGADAAFELGSKAATALFSLSKIGEATVVPMTPGMYAGSLATTASTKSFAAAFCLSSSSKTTMVRKALSNRGFFSIKELTTLSTAVFKL